MLTRTSKVEAFDFEVVKFNVTEIVDHSFNVVGVLHEGNHKTTIKFTDTVNGIKKQVTRFVTDETIGK